MKNKYNKYIFFLIIFIIFLYHFFIQNNLEKTFFQTYFKYDTIKRPLEKCDNYIESDLNCAGMPSGHAEFATIISIILYYYKYIPLWATLTIIFIFSIQRYLSNMHTISQIIFGIIFGLFYSFIYLSVDLSIYSGLIVFLIGFLIVNLSLYKIDSTIENEKNPSWVDPSMLSSILEKKNSPYYLKIFSIYICAIKRDKLFVSWYSLEKMLDILIEKIKKSKIRYDAIIGIKTGGAIISNYVAKKLSIKNYKLKLTRSEYNCNKKSFDAINDFKYRSLLKNYGDYIICEKIENNLQGKNVILIDEMVYSGKTMKESIKYLKDEKKVNLITPMCISRGEKYKKNLNVTYVLPKVVFIWPWGYDN